MTTIEEKFVTHSNRKTADTDLKSSIIEFMRERPFLWNNKHPNYKDHKRREQEFKTFSETIGYSIQEIKRVWHVLRTNFFRAHKLLLERPQNSGENGEKLWKYYSAMEYILNGTSKDDQRELKSTKSIRESRGTKGHKELNNNTSCTGSCSKTRNDQHENIDSDDDHLYARSLTSTLKKFDPTTKEIIKLKFQEIIVTYMQQQDVSQPDL